MKNDMMEYKNYFGSVHYSDDDQILYGRIEGIRAHVSYEGKDVASLKEAFEEAVDDYIDTCHKEGEYPEVPFKGSFNIRIPADLHRIIATNAARHGVSLNKYITEILDRETSKGTKALRIREHRASSRLVGFGTFRISTAKARKAKKVTPKESALNRQE